MSGLSADKRAALRRLVEAAPDEALRELEGALLADPRNADCMDGVRALVAEARQARRAPRTVLAPLVALCRREALIDGGPALPADTVARLWRGLGEAAPALSGHAAQAAATAEPGEPPPALYDDLTAFAAAALRDAHAAFADLLARLETAAVEPARLARLLDLAPVLRTAGRELPQWLRSPAADHAPAVRLAYRDATAVAEDAGPLFLAALAAGLDEPWRVMRLIAAVMQQPGESFLAASELAPIPLELMADVDRRIARVRDFDPHGGMALGAAAAADARVACDTLAEIAGAVRLSREGVWGRRVAAQRRALALAVEGRLREAEPAAEAALPTQASRFTGGRGRRTPRLTRDPDLAAARRAEALLTFLRDTRTTAQVGGFGALRSRVATALEARLDGYADDLLDDLQGAPAELAPRIRAHLSLAADLLACATDPAAAQILRRRAAAA